MIYNFYGYHIDLDKLTIVHPLTRVRRGDNSEVYFEIQTTYNNIFRSGTGPLESIEQDRDDLLSCWRSLGKHTEY